MIRRLYALLVGLWCRCGVCGEHVPGGNVGLHIETEHTEERAA